MIWGVWVTLTDLVFGISKGGNMVKHSVQESCAPFWPEIDGCMPNAKRSINVTYYLVMEGRHVHRNCIRS